MLQNEPHGSQAWPSALSIDLGLAVFQNSNKLDRLIRRPNGTGGGGMHRWTDRRGSGKFTWTGPCIRRRLLAGFLAGSPSSRLRQIGSDAIPSGLAVEEEEGENVVGREARAPAAGGVAGATPSRRIRDSMGLPRAEFHLSGPSMAHYAMRPTEGRSALPCLLPSLRSQSTTQATAQPGEVAARPPARHHRIERMRPPVSRAAFASVLLGRRAVGASLVPARCASSAASPAAAVAAYGEAKTIRMFLVLVDCLAFIQSESK